MKKSLLILLIPFFGLSQFNPIFFNQNSSRGMKNPGSGSLVAFYDFENNGNDSTGLSPTGVPTGTSYDASGKIGSSILFNNTLDTFDVAPNNNFTFSSGSGVDIPFTISFWVNFSSLPAREQYLVNKQDNSDAACGWSIVYNPSVNAIILNKHSSITVLNLQGARVPFVPVINTWYHVVFTDDGSKTNAGMKGYINSVSKTITNNNVGTYTGMPNSNFNMRIGQAAWTTAINVGLLGELDLLNIWKNKVLTPAEINFIYNNYNGRPYPF